MKNTFNSYFLNKQTRSKTFTDNNYFNDTHFFNFFDYLKNLYKYARNLGKYEGFKLG